MNILVTGSSGLIGSRLCAVLAKDNHRVLHMVRRTPARANEVKWDPRAGTLDKSALEGLEAVVHLAGESIASGRWTAEKRRRIRQSRIQGTGLLAQSLANQRLSDRILRRSGRRVARRSGHPGKWLSPGSMPGMGERNGAGREKRNPCGYPPHRHGIECLWRSALINASNLPHGSGR